MSCAVVLLASQVQGCQITHASSVHGSTLKLVYITLTAQLSAGDAKQPARTKKVSHCMPACKPCQASQGHCKRCVLRLPCNEPLPPTL